MATGVNVGAQSSQAPEAEKDRGKAGVPRTNNSAPNPDDDSVTLHLPARLVLDRPETIRFAAVTAAGKRSATWSVTASKNSNDVYMGGRKTMQTLKLSLHQSGRWRMAMTEAAAAEHLAPGDDRVFSRWAPGIELAPGWHTGAYIYVPATAFTDLFPEKKPKGSRIVWCEAPPPPFMMAFSVLLGSPGCNALTLSGAWDVGRMTLTSGAKVDRRRCE